MIQNCLIRREMAKKNWRQMAVFCSSGGTAAVFLKSCKIYVKIRLFSFFTYVLRLKPRVKTTDYMQVAKLPPHLIGFNYFLPKFSPSPSKTQSYHHYEASLISRTHSCQLFVEISKTLGQTSCLTYFTFFISLSLIFDLRIPSSVCLSN